MAAPLIQEEAAAIGRAVAAAGTADEPAAGKEGMAADLTRVRRVRLLTLRWVDRVRLLRRPGIPGSPGRPALDLVLALRRSHLRGVSPRQASHDDHADDPEEKPEREPVTPALVLPDAVRDEPADERDDEKDYQFAR
jgi:hypothetical protein